MVEPRGCGIRFEGILETVGPLDSIATIRHPTSIRSTPMTAESPARLDVQTARGLFDSMSAAEPFCRLIGIEAKL